MKLIDGDELIKRIQDTIDFNRKHNMAITLFSKQHILCILDNMKTVDSVKHGHWIFEDESVSGIKCSACKSSVFWTNAKRPKYCPNCGAKMDGEENAKS